MGSLGVPPSKHRQLHTPVDSPSGSPGHARVYSENSISEPLRTAPFPVRSSSAAARYIGRSVVDGSQRSPPIVQSPKDARGESPSQPRSGHSSSLSKQSPPHGVVLEPLSEDEILADVDADKASSRSSMDGYLSPSGDHKSLTRSASSMQMRDLRDQMQDLKGRLSVLRDRARDDTMKRRSLQSLRTPSPFTAAEQWYTTHKSYGDAGLSADAGVASPTSPKPESGVESALKQAPEYANSDVTSVYEDVAESHHINGPQGNHEPVIEEEVEDEEAYNTAAEEELRANPDDEFEDDYNDEMVNREEADDYESDASLYHDTMSTPISHEDREDAFDYEHFFLHSAMGTISQQRMGRRGSFSSEDSVETTRGPTAPSTDHKDEMRSNERTALGHFRSESTDSVSTLATFATATEGHGSENGDDQNRDNFAVQEVEAPPLRASTPVTAKRSTFGSPTKTVILGDRQSTPETISRPNSAIHDPIDRNGSNFHRPSVASFDSFESTGTTRSFPLVNKPKPQKTSSTSNTPDLKPREQEASLLSDSATLTEGTNSGERLQPSPVHMLAKDDQILVERLVASLGKCVLGLQEAGRSTYEGRVWRRRLDAARRVLEGEEGAM